MLLSYPLPMNMSEHHQHPAAAATMSHHSDPPRECILSAMEPPIGSERNVLVSHVENGPKMFFVQFADVMESSEWKEMARKLQIFPRVPLASVAVGGACTYAVPDGPNRMRVCRAEVKERSEREPDGATVAQVFVCDYGFIFDNVPMNELFELPTEFKRFARQAVACTFGDAELLQFGAITTPSTIAACFKQAVQNKVLKAKFVAMKRTADDCAVFEVKLTDPANGEPIANEVERELMKIQNQHNSAMAAASAMRQLGVAGPSSASAFSTFPGSSRGVGGLAAAASSSGSSAGSHPNAIMAQVLQVKQQMLRQSAENRSVGVASGFTNAMSSAANRAGVGSTFMTNSAAMSSPRARFVSAQNVAQPAFQAFAPPGLMAFGNQAQRLPPLAFPMSFSGAYNYVAAPQLPSRTFFPLQPFGGSIGGGYSHSIPQPNLVLQSAQAMSSLAMQSARAPQQQQAQGVTFSANYQYREFKRRHRDLCLVTHVNHPQRFFIQLAGDKDDIKDLMISIQETYNNPDSLSLYAPSRLFVGSACAYKAVAEGVWYRGKVKQISENFMMVEAVDYGNLDRVAFTDLRTLKPDFLRIIPFAVECQLFGVSPRSVWHPNECNLLTQMVVGRGKELHCLFVEEDQLQPHVYCVELFTTDKLNLNHEFVRIINSQPFSAAAASASFVPQQHQAVADLGGASSLYQPQPVMSLGKLLVKLPSEEKVFVVNVITPMEFWVQPDSYCQQITDVQRQLNQRYSSLKPGEAEFSGPLVNGQICCARSSDSYWYRASVASNVSSAQDGYVSVYLVDYGNCETVLRTHVKQLLPEFTGFPEYALKCQITGIRPRGSSWPPQVFDAFTALQNKVVSLKFCSLNAASQAYEVALVSKSVVVIEDLIRANLVVAGDVDVASGLAANEITPNEPPSHAASNQTQSVRSCAAANRVQHLADVPGFPPLASTVPLGSTVNAIVSFIESTRKFHMQFESQTAAITNLQSDLQHYYNGGNSSSDVTFVKGSLVAAKFSESIGGDGGWYRGVLEQLSPSKFLVFFVDYGNTDEIARCDVKKLENQFRSLPPQAFPCTMSDVSNSQAITAKFQEVSAKFVGLFSVRFDGKVDGGSLHVTLLQTVNGNEYSINDGLNLPSLLPPLS